MLLHVLLLVLYPLSPALRLHEFVRWFLTPAAFRGRTRSSSIFENAYAYGRKYESPAPSPAAAAFSFDDGARRRRVSSPAAAAFLLKMADERVSVCSHPSFSRIRAPP